MVFFGPNSVDACACICLILNIQVFLLELEGLFLGLMLSLHVNVNVFRVRIYVGKIHRLNLSCFHTDTCGDAPSPAVVLQGVSVLYLR